MYIILVHQVSNGISLADLKFATNAGELLAITAQLSDYEVYRLKKKSVKLIYRSKPEVHFPGIDTLITTGQIDR